MLGSTMLSASESAIVSLANLRRKKIEGELAMYFQCQSIRNRRGIDT